MLSSKTRFWNHDRIVPDLPTSLLLDHFNMLGNPVINLILIARIQIVSMR